MLVKNTAAQGVYLYAYLTTTGLPKTGDASNITGAISKDGAASAATATANPTEIGGGVYWQPLSQAETNANAIAIAWSSSTANVLIQPLTVLTDRSGVVVATNNDKTGYALTQSFPANFAALGISSGGKINGVLLVDTLTTYTGNTVQTGDSFTGLSALAGVVALASQIPEHFTDSTFVSAGVFATEALVNAPASGGGGSVTISGYAEGQDPATLLLAIPANKLSTDASGFVTLAPASSPIWGVTVAGSTTASLVLSGLPSGRNYVGQRLYQQVSGEARTVAAQAFSDGNYTFTFGNGTGEAGPFSVVTTGDLVYPVA